MAKNMRDSCIEAHQSGRHNDALRLYGQYLGVAPTDAQMWSNYGALLRATKHFHNAKRAHERAFALSPNSRTIRANYANILSDLGHYAQSIEIRRSLINEKDDDPEQHAMIGRCLRSMGDYQGAWDYLRPWVDHFPDYADIKLQSAMALLALGQYQDAFALYRARWLTNELTPRRMPFPEWTGQPLDGKHIIVMPEQGFGDFVLMSRHVSDLKKLGATVSVVVEKPLFRLMQGLSGADFIVPKPDPNVAHDYWVNMMELGAITLKSDADIRTPVSLNIPDDSARRAGKILSPFRETFNVGVVWTGSVTYRGNAFRSFSHNDFLPLCDVENVQLFSLYKGPMIDAFYDDGAAGLIVDAGSHDRDFADCAALMRELDLVITSDTATAHIAGSLGIPVWVVLHMDAFWVYRHQGATTPWYPSMRLFRQREALRWDDVMTEVRQALIEKVSENG